jgi:hypothetical protein
LFAQPGVQVVEISAATVHERTSGVSARPFKTMIASRPGSRVAEALRVAAAVIALLVAE